MPELPGRDAILSQFNLLMEFLLEGTLTGSMQAGKFQLWEMDILLDVESCDLRGVVRRDALREYRNAVQAELQSGARLPIRFSEYLQRVKDTRARRKPAKPAFATPAHRRTRVR